MDQELYIDGLGIAKGVIETIVTLAVEKIDGVVSVGESVISSGVKTLFVGKQPGHSGIDAAVVDGKLALALRMTVFYGYPFTQLADEIRAVVSDAIRSQVGVEVSAIDVYIDNIVIPKD